jgi:hypothetical protein
MWAMIPLLERQTLDNGKTVFKTDALHRTYDPGHFYSLLCVKLPLEEAQGLPYVLVSRVLSRREWMERYAKQ